MARTTFYMIAERRVGSHLLASLLNNNPHVRCGAEALNEDMHKKWGYRQDEILRGDMSSLGEGPGYKWSDPIPDDPSYPMTLGCTMHGNKIAKLSSADQTLLWSSTSTKKLILRRDNLLLRYLSLQKARKTGYYMERDHPDGYKPTQTKLNYWLARKDFKTVWSRFEMIKSAFEAHGSPTHVVVYEELCAEPERVMQAVFDFLEAPIPEGYDLTPKWDRQEKRPPEEAIANYEQLKKKFSGTEWDRFFS